MPSSFIPPPPALSSPSSGRERQIIQAIKDALAAIGPELRGYRVLLFGSRAAGNARTRSDFDVGVLGPQPQPLASFYKVQELLDDLDTLYRIDWVDLNRASPEFRKQALLATEVLYG